jgi:hypothetical protein
VSENLLAELNLIMQIVLDRLSACEMRGEFPVWSTTKDNFRGSEPGELSWFDGQTRFLMTLK